MLPVLHLPPILLNREIKSGLSVRYQVQSQWEDKTGEGQSRSYQYDLTQNILKFKAPKPGDTVQTDPDQTEGVFGVFKVERMYSATSDMELPMVRLAGVYDARFLSSGMPQDMNMDKEAGTFGLPLLAWFLPASLSKDGFLVPPTVIGTGVEVEGRGTVRSLYRLARFHLRLTIGPRSLDPEKRPMIVEMDTAWDLRRGRLVAADGTVNTPGGVLAFKITGKL